MQEVINALRARRQTEIDLWRKTEHSMNQIRYAKNVNRDEQWTNLVRTRIDAKRNAESIDAAILLLEELS